MSFSDVGHRGAYNDVLRKALSKNDIILTREDPATAEFFPMLDDIKGYFAYRSIRNLLAGKQTVGLFFRPAECFLTTAFKYRLKRMIFGVLRLIPGVTVLTILPFDLNPQFSEVANGWIYDPQLWDVALLDMPRLERSALEAQVQAHSNGRMVISALGTQDERKGFDRFARLWLDYPALRARYLFLAAGQISRSSKALADDFRNSGGLLINELISDETLFRLYALSDIVWSCYSPSYNQASGIFGRAFQFGKPSIVREGSFLAALAETISYSTITIPYDDLNSAANRLLRYSPLNMDSGIHAERVDELRSSSIRTLAEAFAPARAEPPL